MQQDFSENVNGKWEPKLCKIETRNPDANWERIWRNGRLSCLDNNSLSFAFMLIHDLLPSESKVSEIIGSSPPECKFSCQHISDYLHIFFECFHSSAIGDWLSKILTKFDPSTNMSAILKLDFEGSDSVIWLVVQVMGLIWERRKSKKSITLTECREKIYTDAMILLETKHLNTASIILQIISF